MYSFINYKFRIKDSTTAKKLNKMANSVNFVWNYCNETSYQAIKKYSKYLSAYDLMKLTTGTSKDLNISSQTINQTCKIYKDKMVQFKKIKLKWRSSQRNLGWIPLKIQDIKINDDYIKYYGHKFKFWKSREIEGEIKEGSFNQDSKGHWYINLQCEIYDEKQINVQEVGLDLGCKTQATLSDGRKFKRDNITKTYEKQLGMAQRSHKRKLVKTITSKMKNKRRDFNHKIANHILQNVRLLVIGNVSSQKLAKTHLAKSVLDSSWGQLKSFLKYKAIRLGTTVKEVNESWTTRTCSNCLAINGPQGLSDLSIREWICSKCGEIHDRDTNAAKNILRLGLQSPIKGNSAILRVEVNC